MFLKIGFTNWNTIDELWPSRITLCFLFLKKSVKRQNKFPEIPLHPVPFPEIPYLKSFDIELELKGMVKSHQD